MSTVKPPLTLPEMRPVTISPASIEASSSSHTIARFAFSRDSTVSPKPFSRYSSATLTVSPTPTSSSPASLRNCSIGMMPSDFRPALMTTTSERISTTVPETIAPGLSLLSAVWLCSNSSAKDSVIVGYSVGHTGSGSAATHLQCARARGWNTAPDRCGGLTCVGERRGVGAVRRDRSGVARRTESFRQHRQHVLDHLGDGRAGGVHDHRVFRGPQGRHRTSGIALVASGDLVQQAGKGNRNPFFLQLLIAPFGPFLGAGGEEDLVRGVREDHGSHVATVDRKSVV